MRLAETVKVSYKNPVTDVKEEFSLGLDIPETAKDFVAQGNVKEDWDKLASKQWVTNQKNEARRKKVGELSGKTVGMHDLSKLIKELGLTAEQVAAIICGKGI